MSHLSSRLIYIQAGDENRLKNEIDKNFSCTSYFSKKNSIKLIVYKKAVLHTYIHKSFIKTRKLCYRKDDRAMRPIYRCRENFGESLTTPTPPCLQNFCCLRLSLRMFRPNLKFVLNALSVPELIGVRKKLGSPWIRPHPFVYVPEIIGSTA